MCSDVKTNLETGSVWWQALEYGINCEVLGCF